MTSLKSNSKALKQISRSGPPNDWLHTALTPHSFKLVVFRSLSSLHPEDECISSPVGKQTAEWEGHDVTSPRLCRGATLWSLQWLVCKCLSLSARGLTWEVRTGKPEHLQVEGLPAWSSRRLVSAEHLQLVLLQFCSGLTLGRCHTVCQREPQYLGVLRDGGLKVEIVFRMRAPAPATMAFSHGSPWFLYPASN